MDSDKWIQSPAGVTGTRVDSNSGGHLSAVGGVGGGLPALHGPYSYPPHLTVHSCTVGGGQVWSREHHSW